MHVIRTIHFHHMILVTWRQSVGGRHWNFVSSRGLKWTLQSMKLYTSTTPRVLNQG